MRKYVSIKNEMIPECEHPRNRGKPEATVWLENNLDKSDNRSIKQTKHIIINNNENNIKNTEKVKINKNEKDYLNVLYTNADSLSNKFHEVETHAEYYNADLILITEYLSKNPSSNFSDIYHIDGFSCLDNNQGRGVCIFYRDNLEITTHDNINKMFHTSIFINIKTRNKPLNVGLVYRSPNSEEKHNNNLNKQLSFAFKKLKNLTVFGDFNHPNIDWNSNYCKKNEDHCDSKFLFEMTKLNINQLITGSGSGLISSKVLYGYSATVCC